MNVNDTIKYCLLAWPNLFKNKSHVYDYLFLVGGNGYEWIDGQLALKDKNLEKYDGPCFDKLLTEMEKAVLGFTADHLNLFLDEPYEFTGIIQNFNVTELVTDPNTSGAALFKITDDMFIEDDWLLAAFDVSQGIISWCNHQTWAKPKVYSPQQIKGRVNAWLAKRRIFLPLELERDQKAQEAFQREQLRNIPIIGEKTEDGKQRFAADGATTGQPELQYIHGEG